MGWEKRPGWKDGLDEKTSGRDLRDAAGGGNGDVNHVRYGPPWACRKRLRSEGCCEFVSALGRTGTVSDSPAARQVACPHSCEARVKGTAVCGRCFVGKREDSLPCPCQAVVKP